MDETLVNFSFFYILFYIVYFSVALESEKSCSKFPLEHDMLSKIVRMELRMEQMETEMMSQREKMEKFSRDYASLRDIIVVVMENKTAEVARVMEGLNAVEKSRSIVAFSAAAKNHLTVSGTNQPFVFESVITNIGNAYNYTSGHFVAPVSGTYVFYSSILSMPGANFEATIVVNGSIKERLHESGKDGPRYGMASQSVVIELNAGDVVSVNSSPTSSLTKAFGSAYTTFSGFLIR